MNKKTRTVVIGASLGGVEALQTLVAALPADFPAAVLMVLHVGNHPSILPDLLSARGPLKASHAIDGEPVRAGHIHVAPPDHHLLIEGARLRLTRGPKEHHSRPAIDPLFRSAALESGPMVVGVVLTGRLDDGTAGLQAIKECGGIAVVQTPEDAVEPSMPASALKYVQVDHCVPLAQMAGLLVSLIDPKDMRVAPDRVERLVHEHALTLSQGDPMEHLEAIAKPSAFVCPDCKGGLWEVADSQPVRYLCHTGHAFTIRTLQHAQAEGTEAALWGAIRALQERRLILRRMEALQRHDGDVAAADRLQTQERQLASQVDAMQLLVERMPEPVE